MSAKHRKLKHFMHLFRSWQRSDTLIDMTKMWGHFYLKEEIYICTKLTLFAGFYLKIAGNCKKRKLTALPFGAPELTLVLFFLCNIFLFLYATVCAPSFVLIIFRLYIRYYCLFFLKKIALHFPSWFHLEHSWLYHSFSKYVKQILKIIHVYMVGVRIEGKAYGKRHKYLFYKIVLSLQSVNTSQLLKLNLPLVHLLLCITYRHVHV